MDEWEVVPQVAVATAMKAQEQGVARLTKTAEQLFTDATHMIRQVRATTELLMREKIIGF
jgi:malate dehydrogenase (oxaloacetate-decarboxylating)